MNIGNEYRHLRAQIYFLTLIGGLVVSAAIMAGAVQAEGPSPYLSTGAARLSAEAPAANILGNRLLHAPMFNPAAPPAPEAVATYAGDCSTPKIQFNVGDTICVKSTGVPISPFFPRRLVLINANSTIVHSVDITSDPQSNTFTLDATSVVGGITVDNRGTWQAAILNPFFFFKETASTFTVSDAQNATADLGVAAASDGNETSAGSQIAFQIQVKSYGPNNAATVELVNPVPADTTFVSFQQLSGPTFVCSNPDPGMTGTTTCTISSFDWPGPDAQFLAIYEVNAGVASNTQILNTATLSSVTDDQNARNNSSTSTVTVLNAVSGGCTFDCPANVVATATSPSGAIVNFASAINISGSCGAISASPNSGSLFPVGTTVVNVTSDAGPSCSFTVTVSDSAAPTISCPANQNVTADSSGTYSFAPGAIGAPTTNPASGVTVTFERSDDIPAVLDGDGVVITPAVVHSLTDPFPTGTTGITWTVTDSIGRTASCTQNVVVHAPCVSDTEPPTVTAPPDITVGTGPNSTTCGVALDDELGQAEVHDDCSATLSVTGIPSGNLFPIGTTNVTYTATDGAGHTASAVQHVTVTDNTPPVIFAPANASYTCPNEVPALSPTQAFGPDVNGNPDPSRPVFDNCGSPTVTASETSSGAGSAASPRIIVRTYTALDTHGNTASASQTITVIDPTPPTFTFVPADVTAYTGPGATTCDAVVNPGTATATDNCGVVTVTRSPSGNTFGVGTTTITWTATDGAGNTATATQNVTVIDNTVPVITTNGQTPSMWPPNHKYHTFQLTQFVTGATDNCGGISINDVVIEKVTSDEIENGNGDGNTTNDIVIAANCKSVQLRSEREGNGNGRVYTITFKVTDTHGNVGRVTARVVVPHNPGETAVDSGVQYTVNGTCP
jgi:uncharacterized repeat protein (TIGR01451 family)